MIKMVLKFTIQEARIAMNIEPTISRLKSVAIKIGIKSKIQKLDNLTNASKLLNSNIKLAVKLDNLVDSGTGSLKIVSLLP